MIELLPFVAVVESCELLLLFEFGCGLSRLRASGMIGDRCASRTWLLPAPGEAGGARGCSGSSVCACDRFSDASAAGARRELGEWSRRCSRRLACGRKR